MIGQWCAGTLAPVTGPSEGHGDGNPKRNNPPIAKTRVPTLLVWEMALPVGAQTLTKSLALDFFVQGGCAAAVQAGVKERHFPLDAGTIC